MVWADAEAGEVIRHRDVVFRHLGDKLVVARPGDGAPVVLAPTAAVIWHLLDDWVTVGAIDLHLAEIFPSIAEAERAAAVRAIVVTLTDDGLLERA